MVKANVPTKLTDNEILELVINGDQQVYRELVNRYKNYVFTACYRILGRHEDAEEAAQDAFVKAYRSLSSFDGRAKFSTWLYRIAINTSITKKRKKRIRTEEIEDYKIGNKGIDGHSEFVKKEHAGFLQDAFNLMKESEVSLITLFYLEELSLQEIADITGLEANNVKVKLHRARKRLKEKLQIILKEEVNSLL